MDVVERIEAQHKQNAVHVIRQQTASHEGTDAMSDPDPDPRWRRDRVLYRISLHQCCVRSWINIRRTHQVTCWKVFLPSAAVAHCSPDTVNRCSQNICSWFFNQSHGLLQQCFWQCQCCSFVSTSIGGARCYACHHVEKKVRPYFCNNPWSAALAAS